TRGAARARSAVPPLPSLPSAALRQGRALPPDDEGVLGPSATRRLDRAAPGPGRSVCRLLQRGEAAPGQGTQTAEGRLRGARQGEAIRTDDPGRSRRESAKGSDRQE